MKVTIFGATGVVGQALLPLLAEHDVTAVSRTQRDDDRTRWLAADVATGNGVAERSTGPRSSTTSFIRSDRPISSSRTARPPMPSRVLLRVRV